MKAICKKIPKNLLFLGFAGSGKDTQADLICKICDGEKISTGDLARAEVKSGSKLGKIAGEHMSKGHLIPDEVIHEILRSQLSNFDNDKLWAFSGTVRTVEQIPMFDETLGKFNRKLDKVIFLDLSDETIVNRLSKRRYCSKCNKTYHPDFKKSKIEGICDMDGEVLIQRDDDRAEIVRTRIRVEKKTINPVLDEYEKRGILFRVDGEPLIDEIHEDLVKKLSDEG